MVLAVPDGEPAHLPAPVGGDASTDDHGWETTRRFTRALQLGPLIRSVLAAHCWLQPN